MKVVNQIVVKETAVIDTVVDDTAMYAVQI